jgi:hypothetical protein
MTEALYTSRNVCWKTIPIEIKDEYLCVNDITKHFPGIKPDVFYKAHPPKKYQDASLQSLIFYERRPYQKTYMHEKYVQVFIDYIAKRVNRILRYSVKLERDLPRVGIDCRTYITGDKIYSISDLEQAYKVLFNDFQPSPDQLCKGPLDFSNLDGSRFLNERYLALFVYWARQERWSIKVSFILKRFSWLI